jgi:hypothetical protein
LAAVVPPNQQLAAFAESWSNNGLWLGLAPFLAVAAAVLGALVSGLLPRIPPRAVPQTRQAGQQSGSGQAARSANLVAMVIVACALAVGLAFLATPPQRALAAEVAEGQLPGWVASLWEALIAPASLTAGGFPWPPLALGLVSGIALLSLSAGSELEAANRRGTSAAFAIGWATALVAGLHALATTIMVSTQPGSSAVPDSLLVCLGTLAACGMAAALLRTRSVPT